MNIFIIIILFSVLWLSVCKARYQAHDGSGCLSRLYHYSFYIQHHLMFTTRFNGNSFIIQPHKQMLSIELGEKDMIFHCRPLQNVGKMVKVHFVRKIKQTQIERRRKKRITNDSICSMFFFSTKLDIFCSSDFQSERTPKRITV